MAREKLTLEDFDTRFSRDGNRLFFDDKEIQTEVHLTPKQTLLAVAGIVFAILSAIATCTNTAITIWSTFYKKPIVNQNAGTTDTKGAGAGVVPVQADPSAVTTDTNDGPASAPAIAPHPNHKKTVKASQIPVSPAR